MTNIPDSREKGGPNIFTYSKGIPQQQEQKIM